MIIGAEKSVILAMLLMGAGGAVSFLVKDFKLKASIGLVFSLAASISSFSAVFDVFYGIPSDGMILTLPGFEFLKFRIHVDGISAIFLFLLAIILPFVFQFSAAYAKGRSELKNFYPFIFFLTLSVYGLLTVADLLIILGLFWQLMAFCGWWLIKYGEGERKKDAAKNFFIWMQAGFFFVMCGAVLLTVASGNSGFSYFDSYFELFDFNTLSERIGDAFTSNPLLANLAVLLLTLGFAIKLGVVPFGLFWLADSYDSAPSPITALFSSVISKTGLYGLIRTFINLLPETPIDNFNYQVWGIVLGGIGAATLVAGTWRAFVEKEIKRILAYASMASAGLILISLGACVSILTVSEKASTVATIALIGAFVYFINHGVANALLFLNAGTVIGFAKSRVMGSVSGLARILPLTCLCGLIASLVAAGLPPLNGFTGKWFIYAASIKSSTYLPAFAILSGIAILAGIATVVIFIKYFGSIFLSQPAQNPAGFNEKKDGKSGYVESNSNWMVPQIGLCFISILFSLFPQIVIGLVTKLLVKNPHGLGKLVAKGVNKFHEYDMGIHWGTGHAPVCMFATLAFAYSVATILSRCGESQRTSREPWLCGYQRHTPYTQYPPSHICYDLIKSVRKRLPAAFDEKQSEYALASKTDNEKSGMSGRGQTGAGSGFTRNNDC